MRGPKQSRHEREYHLRRVSDLYLQGKSQVDIAGITGVTQQQISYDIAAVHKRWREDTVIDFDAEKQKELARIDTLERTYWEAWERTLEEKVKTRTEQSTNGKADKDGSTKAAKASVEKETMLGNPAYLAGVMSCIERRAKLLGLDAPAKVAPTTPDGKEPAQLVSFYLPVNGRD